MRNLLYEIVYFEIINVKFTTEVNIQQQQQEFLFNKKDLYVIGVDGFSNQWGFFASDHSLLSLPIIDMRMARTAYLYYRDVIKFIQTVNKKIQVVINGTGRKQAQKHFNR